MHDEALHNRLNAMFWDARYEGTRNPFKRIYYYMKRRNAERNERYNEGMKYGSCSNDQD